MKLRKTPLSIQQILAWADAHHRRTADWPALSSGKVRGAPDEDWARIDVCLRQGYRGFRGGNSLSKLLGKHRGIPQGRAGKITIKEILALVDAHKRRTGRWPGIRCGNIPGAPHINWRGVDNALRMGLRGLPSGSSLPQLLAAKRGVRNKKDRPLLTFAKILAWADDHHRRTGSWPTAESGTVLANPDETWRAIGGAFNLGTRGQPGGSSLARFLAERRGVRNRKDVPMLLIKQILVWADAHYRRTGRWPTDKSGPVHGAPGETWLAVCRALYSGHRGLPGGRSLSQLLDKYRPATRKNRRGPPSGSRTRRKPRHKR